MNRTWQEVMQELADDLEGEISSRYPDASRSTYQGQNRRYERDMLIVKDARLLLQGEGYATPTTL